MKRELRSQSMYEKNDKYHKFFRCAFHVELKLRFFKATKFTIRGDLPFPILLSGVFPSTPIFIYEVVSPFFLASFVCPKNHNTFSTVSRPVKSGLTAGVFRYPRGVCLLPFSFFRRWWAALTCKCRPFFSYMKRASKSKQGAYFWLHVWVVISYHLSSKFFGNGIVKP